MLSLGAGRWAWLYCWVYGMPTPPLMQVAAACSWPRRRPFGARRCARALFILLLCLVLRRDQPAVCLGGVSQPAAISLVRVSDGWPAILLSLSLFLIPFLVVNDPVLLLEGKGPIGDRSRGDSADAWGATLTLGDHRLSMAPIQRYARLGALRRLSSRFRAWASDLSVDWCGTVVFGGLLLSGRVGFGLHVPPTASRSP